MLTTERNLMIGVVDVDAIVNSLSTLTETSERSLQYKNIHFNFIPNKLLVVPTD